MLSKVSCFALRMDIHYLCWFVDRFFGSSGTIHMMIDSHVQETCVLSFLSTFAEWLRWLSSMG